MAVFAQLQTYRCSGTIAGSVATKVNNVTDITITVAICLAAISASLLLAKQVAIEVAREYSYGAMVVFGVHIFGIVISAPVASGPAEIVAIVSFAWLMIATLALSVKGFLGVMGDRGSTVKGS